MNTIADTAWRAIAGAYLVVLLLVPMSRTVDPASTLKVSNLDASGTVGTDNLASHTGGATVIAVTSSLDEGISLKSDVLAPHTPGGAVTVASQALSSGSTVVNSFDYDYGGEVAPTTSASNGLAAFSNNTAGRMRPGAQNSVTLTFGAPLPPDGAFCAGWPRSTLGTLGVEVEVDDSAAATTGVITFNCFDTNTKLATTCIDITYRCERF